MRRSRWHRNRWTKLITAHAAICIMALATGGCGGDDDDGVSPPTVTAIPTATQPAPTATPTMGGGQLDIAICAPDAGPFSAEIDHPFFPLPVGTQWIFTGDEDGVPIRLVITALPDTEVVAGVTTRVIEEREWADGDLAEVSRNFFVETADGTVCYYGEDVDDYEAGQIVSHAGAWRAGVNGALPGIFMPANPQVGHRFKQEVAIGIAEDEAELVAAGETVNVGLGSFSDTIRFVETTPLESGSSEKVYARGTGLLRDDILERISSSLTVCGTLDGTGCAPDGQRVDLGMPSFSNPTEVTNPLFPVSIQHSVVLLGTVDGEPFRAEVTLLPDTVRIPLGAGVESLESQYVAYIGGRLHEVALDWYAQDDAGAVWYLGEDVFNYEDGSLADTAGTWLAGRDGPGAMIMPANPAVGMVYRPENIPGLVFEEVTVQDVDVVVDAPYGQVSGAILIEELHLDGSTETKSFAPGYGEFFTGSGNDVEALALAVPTDALTTVLPAELGTITDRAGEILTAADDEDWDAAATAVGQLNAAWQTYRGAGVALRLEEQLVEALDRLTAAVDAQEGGDARQGAIDVARATLDFHLRHRSPTEVDHDRFRLWAQQVLLDVDDEDLAAVSGDAITLRWVANRFVHTLSPAETTALRSNLDTLDAAVGSEDLDAAAAAAEALIAPERAGRPRSR